jgi:hypothetical protein
MKSGSLDPNPTVQNRGWRDEIVVARGWIGGMDHMPRKGTPNSNLVVDQQMDDPDPFFPLRSRQRRNPASHGSAMARTPESPVLVPKLRYESSNKQR